MRGIANAKPDTLAGRRINDVTHLRISPFAKNPLIPLIVRILQWINPFLNAKTAGWSHAGVIWNLHILVGTVKAERLPDFAGREACPIYQRAAVAAKTIASAAFCRPPADQATGGWHAHR